MSLLVVNEYINNARDIDGSQFIWVKVKNAQDYCIANGIIRGKYPDMTASCQGCENIFQILDHYLRTTSGTVDPMIYTFWDDGKQKTLNLALCVNDGEIRPMGEMVIQLTNPKIIIYFSTNNHPFTDEDTIDYRFVDMTEFNFQSDTKLLN